MFNNKKYNQISWHNIALAVVFFAFGYVAFPHIQSAQYEKPSEENFNLFWDVWDIVEEKYPFDEPNDEDKVYGAIAGLVESYDDEYSTFLPPTESNFFDETITGEFGGIGAEITVRNGYLSVITPLKNSPAEKSGIKPADIITHVDDIDIVRPTYDVS